MGVMEGVQIWVDSAGQPTFLTEHASSAHSFSPYSLRDSGYVTKPTPLFLKGEVNYPSNRFLRQEGLNGTKFGQVTDLNGQRDWTQFNEKSISLSGLV